MATARRTRPGVTISIHNDVLERVALADPDRMRAARLAEPDMRDRLFALYAFHAELAKVPELVSEPMLGQIRYQWWRECLDEIYGSGPVRKHEVSTPLAEMVEQSGVSRFLLERIIDGRERDLDPRPFASIVEATEYADATSGALLNAALAVIGEDGRNAAGRAWGLTGLARGYRYYADSMLKEVAFAEIVSAAREAYDEARGRAPAGAVPALAYVALVPGYLRRMSGAGYDPTQAVPDYAPFAKQLRMLGAVARGRI